jgi:hypothetical protein
MNDFTIEELKDILAALYYSSTLPHLFVGDLKFKIHSMIDNYCAHSESQADHNYDVERCKQCGRLFI